MKKNKRKLRSNDFIDQHQPNCVHCLGNAYGSTAPDIVYKSSRPCVTQLANYDQWSNPVSFEAAFCLTSANSAPPNNKSTRKNTLHHQQSTMDHQTLRSIDCRCQWQTTTICSHRTQISRITRLHRWPLLIFLFLMCQYSTAAYGKFTSFLSCVYLFAGFYAHTIAYYFSIQIDLLNN